MDVEDYVELDSVNENVTFELIRIAAERLASVII